MIKKQYRRSQTGYFNNFILSHDGEDVIEERLKPYKGTIAKSKNKYYIPANIGFGLGYLNKIDADNSVEFGVDVNRLMVPASPDNTDPEAVNHYFTQSVVNSYFNSFSSKYGMPFSESLKASVGVEYSYISRFYLRGGYFIDNNKSLGNMQYFTLGTSFQYQQSKFNISYLVPSGGGITKNPLSNTLRFGSIFYF